MFYFELARNNGIKNLKNPSWQKVVNREYDQWKIPVTRIDTAGKTITESIEDLIKGLELNL